MMMWIDKYIEMISKEDISIEEINNARLFKNQYVPKSLYKYRSVNDKSLDNIKNNTIWLSNALDLNDLYDSAVTFDADKLLNEMIRENREYLDGLNLSDTELKRLKSSQDTLNELIDITFEKDPQFLNSDRSQTIRSKISQYFKKDNHEKTSRFVEGTQKSTYICSFAAKFDSINMWSHYANSNKGFCVEYGLDSDHFKNMIFPVKYSGKIFDVTTILKNARRGNTNNLYSYVTAMHKSSDWSYEEEWRIILPIGMNYSSRNIQAPAITAIYLGSRISTENETKIIDIANKSGIECYKMKMSNEQFKLIAEKIN